MFALKSAAARAELAPPFCLLVRLVIWGRTSGLLRQTSALCRRSAVCRGRLDEAAHPARVRVLQGDAQDGAGDRSGRASARAGTGNAASRSKPQRPTHQRPAAARLRPFVCLFVCVLCRAVRAFPLFRAGFALCCRRSTPSRSSGCGCCRHGAGPAALCLPTGANRPLA